MRLILVFIASLMLIRAENVSGGEDGLVLLYDRFESENDIMQLVYLNFVMKFKDMKKALDDITNALNNGNLKEDSKVTDAKKNDMTAIIEAIDADLKELKEVSEDTYMRKGIIQPHEFHEINNSLVNTTDYLVYFDMDMGSLNLSFNEAKMETIKKAKKRDWSVLDLLREGSFEVLTNIKAKPFD